MLSEAVTVIELAMGQGSVRLVPVPLHKGKRRQRGFNQAELIAKSALKLLPADRFELATDILIRTRPTESQIGLTSHQRRENLRGAFAVPHPAEVKNREVLLIDDVYTTGTTATECARILRRAGTSRVWVATAARTLKLASKYQEIEPEESGLQRAGFIVSTIEVFENDAEVSRL
jgi:ComF family protein